MADTFRDKIEAYVDERWLIPCKDQLVWVYYAGINVQVEMQNHGLKPGEWTGAFLQYKNPKTRLEGLYLIKTTSLPAVKGGAFNAELYSERIMLSSWYDNADKDFTNPEVTAMKPKYHGLNDCAHFVTQSLAAGGINVQTTGVPTLLNSLRGLADTKTLALTVSAAHAENIIKAGIMKVGDVIIYSLTPTDHHHSVVYKGAEKIAMHTWANHPNHPTIKGDWKQSADEFHPLVTLIHFGRDDLLSPLRLFLVGWWLVTVPSTGQTYYYFFRDNGSAAWTSKRPANVSQPIAAPEGKGYWFQDGMSLQICWTNTGSFEKFDSVSPASVGTFTGTWLSGPVSRPLNMSKLF